MLREAEEQGVEVVPKGGGDYEKGNGSADEGGTIQKTQPSIFCISFKS